MSADDGVSETLSDLLDIQALAKKTSQFKISWGHAFDMPAKRGRPPKFEPDTAREAVMMTFWRKGYVQTSLDDLVRETGASRASLYKTFGDKKAMFALALDSYASLFEARAAAAMAELPDARAVLHALLTASAERLGADDGPPGCLRCNSTLEIGGVDPDLDAALLHANTRYKEVVAAVLRRGVEEGSLRTSQVKALADFYTATVAGMVTTARAGADLAALQHIVEIAMCAWPPGGRAALQR